MSHGSWAAARRVAHNDYVRRMIPGDRRTPDQQGLQLPGDGRVNPRPDVRVVRETPTTRVLDGDGGLGHIVCMQATDWAIETAKRFGTAAATCCNHFHVGAVGFCERTEPPGPAAWPVPRLSPDLAECTQTLVPLCGPAASQSPSRASAPPTGTSPEPPSATPQSPPRGRPPSRSRSTHLVRSRSVSPPARQSSRTLSWTAGVACCRRAPRDLTLRASSPAARAAFSSS